jgi:hypothetical protein
MFESQYLRNLGIVLTPIHKKVGKSNLIILCGLPAVARLPKGLFGGQALAKAGLSTGVLCSASRPSNYGNYEDFATRAYKYMRTCCDSAQHGEYTYGLL